jgi:ribosomal-protein-alanine N-acetyltransferase
VTLEVRAGNTAARALYERMGFQTVGHRAEYYSTSQGREDALLMSMLLHEAQ